MLAEACYDAGLTEDANTIMDELGSETIEVLNYYLSQKKRFQSANKDEIQRSLATLQRVYLVAEKKGQKDLSKKYEADLSRFLQSYQN